MIFIFAAHYGEVENIIKQKKMGKRKISFPFLQYSANGWEESEAKKEQKQAGKERSCMKESAAADGRILLTICGEGRNNAAAAVAATLARESAKRGDILLSIGSGRAFFGKMVFDSCLGRGRKRKGFLPGASLSDRLSHGKTDYRG